MIIEEPTNIELVDVNGKRKKALGKVRNVEISLGGKCVTKMTLQVTDATSYNLILGNDWLTQIHALINIREERMLAMDIPSEEIIRHYISVYKDSNKGFNGTIESISQDEEPIIEEDDLQEIEVYYQQDYKDLMKNEFESKIDEEEYYWDNKTVISEKSVQPIKKLKRKEKDIHFDDLDFAQRTELDTLIEENEHLFAKDIYDLGKTDVYEHTIPTGDNHPKKQRLRTYSPEQNEFIQEEVKKLKDAGIIRDGSKNWAANVVVVDKKNGKKRLCIDYRQLNSITTIDSYPLPRIQETLDAFHGAKWFTTLDLASGYWQILIAMMDIQKTGFITQRGFYEFVRMPFGLTNAPATFQRLMDKILEAEIGKFVQVYLDDIIIYSETWEEHLEHIKQVFQRLEDAGLKMGKEKCFFALKELEFVGHRISREGIKPDPKKIDKINNWPTPTSKTGARGFLGMVGYYRRFIKDFSKIGKPIFDVIGKESFHWGEKQQQAMDILKKAIIEEAVLKYPNFTKPFILYTDASGGGLGAVLSQLDENEIERPIAFASKTIHGAQIRYSASELEFMAMHWAVTKQYKQYLLGKPFTLITDHQALKGLMKSDEGGRRITKWRQNLSVYEPYMEIKYTKAEKNQHADALSRMMNENTAAAA